MTDDKIAADYYKDVDAFELLQEALGSGSWHMEFNENADVTFALKGITPKYCVREAIEGMKRRKTIIIPSFTMRAAAMGMRLLPDSILVGMAGSQQRKKLSGKE